VDAILWPKRVNAILWPRGSWRGDVLTRRSFLPVIIMPTSKFCVSFTPTVPNDTAGLSTHEFTLDLGLGNGARRVSGASGARVTTGEGPPAKHATVAPEAVPVQDPATSTRRGSFNSDWNNGYPHEWPSIEAFNEWRLSKERTHTGAHSYDRTQSRQSQARCGDARQNSMDDEARLPLHAPKNRTKSGPEEASGKPA